VRGRRSTTTPTDDEEKMTFRVVVVFYSRTAKLVTLANVIAEGARAVGGAEVRVVRARDVVDDDDGTTAYERGILDTAIATPEDVFEADCLLIGAPVRHGVAATAMTAFLERAGRAAARGGTTPFKGKVGGVFAEFGEIGIGGHETMMMSAHAWFMQHGMIAVGAPPAAAAAAAAAETSGVSALGAYSFRVDFFFDARCERRERERERETDERCFFVCFLGTVIAARESFMSTPGVRELSEAEVKLAYAQGEWAAAVAKQLHDDGEG